MAELEENTTELKYRVERVEKTDPPAGMPEGNWHRYVIGKGRSKIEGFKPGSLKSVTQYAETAAEDLNARAIRGNSVFASRKRK